MSLAFEIIVVVVLVFVNGFFAMSELAVVSSRKVRLMSLAERGSRGARTALTLVEQPARFLSAVQIGITLVGVLAGAYSGATLAEPLAKALGQFPSIAELADVIAVSLVVLVVTYASLIVGELVPKQIALRNPERIAALVARPMVWLATVAAPLVWLLDGSSQALLRLVGGRKTTDPAVTEEEVRAVIDEGAQAGALMPEEKDMLAGVMRFADRRVSALMTPRPDIAWLDINDDPDSIVRTIAESNHSRFLVADGDLDELLGIVQPKDLLCRAHRNEPLDLRALLHEAPIIPESISALALVSYLKTTALHMAVVVDEYGSVEGLVTATDILSAIVGALQMPTVQRREDGSWLLDGNLPIDEVKALLNLRSLPGEKNFNTLAGFMLDRLRSIPERGAHVQWAGYRFEVTVMDGNRIGKVMTWHGHD